MNFLHIINRSWFVIYAKIIDRSIQPCFFVLLSGNSLDLFHKHIGSSLISESFAVTSVILSPLAKI